MFWAVVVIFQRRRQINSAVMDLKEDQDDQKTVWATVFATQNGCEVIAIGLAVVRTGLAGPGAMKQISFGHCPQGCGCLSDKTDVGTVPEGLWTSIVGPTAKTFA